MGALLELAERRAKGIEICRACRNLIRELEENRVQCWNNVPVEEIEQCKDFEPQEGKDYLCDLGCDLRCFKCKHFYSHDHDETGNPINITCKVIRQPGKCPGRNALAICSDLRDLFALLLLDAEEDTEEE